MLLKISDDFDLEKIIKCGQCFRAEETVDGYYRFIYRNNVLLIRKTSDHTVEVDTDGTAWNTVWFRYFDLERHYGAIRKSIDHRDSFMLKASAEGAGIRILRQDPWETLISFIISQRKSIPAIRQSVRLIAEHWGSALETYNETLYCFPTPEQLSAATESELRACKLGYRVPYIIDAINCVMSGTIDLEALYTCDCETLMQRLLKIRGVGVKVASCVALFAYGKTAAAPVDTWINKIIEKEYGGVNPFEQYEDRAGIMQQYAFWYAQNHKQDYNS